MENNLEGTRDRWVLFPSCSRHIWMEACAPSSDDVTSSMVDQTYIQNPGEGWLRATSETLDAY
jgi:hypothetical protein